MLSENDETLLFQYQRNFGFLIIFQKTNIKDIYMSTLYEKLGGANAIDAVVDKFYDYMLADTNINHFFKNTNMNKQRMRQKQFITMITGGPHNYQGKDMKTAHQQIKITKIDFDKTWNHLLQALEFYKVQNKCQQQLKKVFYSVQADVVNSKEIEKKTLYERLGQETAINAVVDKFYEFMLSDPVTAPFFANTDMKKQAARQKQFIIMATGGPNKYQGADMKHAHQKFKIGKKEFDETWHNLQKALNFFKVNNAEITDLKAVFYSVEADILTIKQSLKPVDQKFIQFSKAALLNPNVKLFKQIIGGISTPNPHIPKKSLFQRLGGQEAINAVVDRFYQYMLNDTITRPFFANTDMKKQAARQKQFIIMATGGPNKYQGADMKHAHQKFKIGKKEFDETWHNLQKALNFFKVNNAEITDLKAVFYSVEADVIHL